MNIPKWAQRPLAAIGLATLSVGAVEIGNNVKDKIDRTIHLSGTPEQAEQAIRAKFPDQQVQDDAIESLYRRLEHIVGNNGRVISLSGDFYLNTDHGNSLFTEGFDHSQRAKVEITNDNGGKEVVDLDMTEVPQDVIDNSLQIPREGQ